MFTTYYYIIILLFQSFLAESNFEYNQQIKIVNSEINNGNYSLALTLVKQLEKKSIFTNNELIRMDRNLSLKIHKPFNITDYSPRSMSDYVIKTLSYYQNKDFYTSIEFTKSSLQSSFASDSLIKIYELVAEKSPMHIQKKELTKQQVSTYKIQLNEAMNLLDLMKRREKTLF